MRIAARESALLIQCPYRDIYFWPFLLLPPIVYIHCEHSVLWREPQTSPVLHTQATPEASDCRAANSTPEGRTMLSDMGWTDPRQGILPLGLVRVLHTAAC